MYSRYTRLRGRAGVDEELDRHLARSAAMPVDRSASRRVVGRGEGPADDRLRPARRSASTRDRDSASGHSARLRTRRGEDQQGRGAPDRPAGRRPRSRDSARDSRAADGSRSRRPSHSCVSTGRVVASAANPSRKWRTDCTTSASASTGMATAPRTRDARASGLLGRRRRSGCRRRSPFGGHRRLVRGGRIGGGGGGGDRARARCAA